MADLTFWPPTLPAGLRDLPAQVADVLGIAAAASDDLAAVDGPLLLIVGGDALASLPEIDRVVSDRSDATAVVIGDGWIGTDGPDVAEAIAGAAAVALVRSIAVRRTPTGRVNVVCVPEALVGTAGSQRGPLGLEIGSADVAEVIAFVLGDRSSYIDGQVLYADGGRQLFSSLTA